MKKVFIFLMLSFLPLIMFAKIETTYLSVQGVGDSKSEAIRNALIESIKQTNGVAIDSKRQYYKAINEVGVSTDGDSSHSILISEHTQKRIREATSGFIKNYSISNAYQESGQWYVDLKIKFSNYKAPGHSAHKRRKIAIIPFEYKYTYDMFRQKELGSKVSKIFTQSLISKITQSRKFSILDRENNKYYQQEKNMILSGDADKQEFLKLGKKLGADYLLVGQLLDFSIDRTVETSSIGLPSIVSTKCNATISYRIIVMATSQIKWSETISKTFDLDENLAQTSSEAILASTSDVLSGKIVENILSNIYPPKIVAVTSNSIIINQGGNSIQKNSIYKVYSNGQRLVDPYTNEFLGYEEIKVAEVVITTIKPKVSYARILRGKVSKGMILRKIKSNGNVVFQSDGEATTDVQIDSNGGVKLPFD